MENVYVPLGEDEKLNIATVMNGYSSEEDLRMCRAWFHFVRKYHPTDNIIVYYSDSIHPSLIRDDVEYVKLNLEGVPSVMGFHHKRVKLGVHQEWCKYEHVIFIDVDAYPLINLRDAFNRCRKPVTFCGHDWDYNLLNSGFFIQRENNFTHVDLIKVLTENGGRVKYQGTDQALIKMYYDKIGYDPFDYEVLAQEYNGVADVESIEVVDDEVVAISKYNGEKLKVIHGYGCFKFWKNPKTLDFWEHIKTIVG